MSLVANQLINGLGFAFNTKSQDAQQWAQVIGETIWSYTTTLQPFSTGIAGGKATFIGTFVNESYSLDFYLTRALTIALPQYGIALAAGQLTSGFIGTPPTNPLPNFQGIFDSNRDQELTNSQSANVLGSAIHNWFISGFATNIATGIVVPWGAPVTAVTGPGDPIVPSFELSAEELEAYEQTLDALKENFSQDSDLDEFDDIEDDDDEYGTIVAADEINKHETIFEESEEMSREVDYDEVQFNELREGQNPINKKGGTLGDRIVEIAFSDVGIAESYGRNYGGKKVEGSPEKNGELPRKKEGARYTDAGRIDRMLADAGLPTNARSVYNGVNLQADSDSPKRKGNSHGTGYSWCASAVTTWWKEAGAAHPVYYKYNDQTAMKAKADQRHPDTGVRFPKVKKGKVKAWKPASCPGWEKWAKYNGLWLEKDAIPSAGYAILYYKPSKGRMAHIGIVAGVRKDGKIVTIEGNTSGLKGRPSVESLLQAPDLDVNKLDREGSGCRIKVANAKDIGGYVKCVPVGSLAANDPGASTVNTIYPDVVDK